MITAERLLKLLLIGCGVACVAGLPGLYIPRSWMVAGHEWLGMGQFPAGPLGEHMARLCSGLYAIYGALCLIMATDVRRYAPMISAQVVMILALAISGGIYGWPIGVPKWWIIADIGACVFYCAATFALQAHIRAADRHAGPQT